MNTRSTVKVTTRDQKSTTRCLPLTEHCQTSVPDSACDATTAIIRAAVALHEAAACIAGLEVRLKNVEAAMAHLEPSPLPVKHLLPVPSLPAVDAETRSHVDTSVAAFWLNRTPQTLRKWACYENGPLRPVRIQGRLGWAVADIRRILASNQE